MSTYTIVFRGISQEFTSEECKTLCLELVAAYRVGTTRDKERLIQDILDLVMGMTFRTYFMINSPSDRKDLAQEFRLSVIKAIDTFDESRGNSFQTYVSWKFKGTFNAWRYYQAETVRSKDGRFNRKTKTHSLDAQSSSASFGGASDQTYKDMIRQDDSEFEYKELFPRITTVMEYAAEILSEKQYRIFQAYIECDGNVTTASHKVGFSHQYLSQEMPRIFKLISRGFKDAI